MNKICEYKDFSIYEVESDYWDNEEDGKDGNFVVISDTERSERLGTRMHLSNDCELAESGYDAWYKTEALAKEMIDEYCEGQT